MFPNSLILALEPDYENFKLAVENTRLCANVEVLNLALGDCYGEMRLYSRGENNHLGATLLQDLPDRSNNGTIVTVKKLASLLEDKGYQECQFMKCDIEGAEAAILDAENSDLINHLLIELHPHFEASITEKWRLFNVNRYSIDVEGEKHFSSKKSEQHEH